jgi:hypothetical protein
MNRSKLMETLEAIGKPLTLWESSDGTKVLVLPYGGRVLGLFAPNDDDNFFWSNPALANAKTAREFYQGQQWHNSGGERTWLAPEVDFFFPKFPNLKHYYQQRELDPGNYQPSSKHGMLSWATTATLTLSRSGRKVDLEISKSLSPALNPLRYDRSQSDAAVKYAGYSVRTTLQFTSTGVPPQVGLWNLMQLPHGGDMLVPSFSYSQPKIYMGSIGGDDLTVGDHLIRYRMRAAGEHKMGVRAIALTGRAGYLHGAGGESSLIIRNFNVNPSAEYVDVPWTETENFGFVFQACNVNSDLGAFSEMEYHVGAIGSRDGCTYSEDHSQVWGFRGPADAVKAIARRLLSSDIE